MRFPHEESGKKRKLSKTWHGPYRVIKKKDPDVTVVPVYFPESGPIQVHQRVCPCPPKWPTGFYCYGGNRLSRGALPKWLDKLLSCEPGTNASTETDEVSPRVEVNAHPEKEIVDTESERVADHNEDDGDGDGDGDGDETHTEGSALPERTLPPGGRYCLRQKVQPPKRLI